jgi:hypothetical protein
VTQGRGVGRIVHSTGLDAFGRSSPGRTTESPRSTKPVNNTTGLDVSARGVPRLCKVSRRVLRLLPVAEVEGYRVAVRFRGRFPAGIGAPGGLAGAAGVATDGEAAGVPGVARFFEALPGGRWRVRSDRAVVGEDCRVDCVYVAETVTASRSSWRRMLAETLAGTSRPFVSQRRLAELVGVSVSQVRRYLRAVGRWPNVEDCGIEFGKAELAQAWATASGMSAELGGFYFVRREDRGPVLRYCIYRRLPNTYQRPDVRVRTGSRWGSPEPLPWEAVAGRPGVWREKRGLFWLTDGRLTQ